MTTAAGVVISSAPSPPWRPDPPLPSPHDPAFRSLRTIVMSKRDQLAAAFARIDADASRLVAAETWCEVMEEVTGLHIDWLHVKDDIVQVWGGGRKCGG